MSFFNMSFYIGSLYIIHFVNNACSLWLWESTNLVYAQGGVVINAMKEYDVVKWQRFNNSWNSVLYVISCLFSVLLVTLKIHVSIVSYNNEKQLIDIQIEVSDGIFTIGGAVWHGDHGAGPSACESVVARPVTHLKDCRYNTSVL